MAFLIFFSAGSASARLTARLTDERSMFIRRATSAPEFLSSRTAKWLFRSHAREICCLQEGPDSSDRLTPRWAETTSSTMSRSMRDRFLAPARLLRKTASFSRSGSGFVIKRYPVILDFQCFGDGLRIFRCHF